MAGNQNNRMLRKLRERRRAENLTRGKHRVGADKRPSFIQRLKMKGYKTIITAVLAIVASFFPGMKEWIAQNPTEYASIIGTIMIVLRIITKTPVGKAVEVPPGARMLPIFLAVSAAGCLSSCAATDQMGSVFKGLSARIGMDGSGAIVEAAVPPGYGLGLKVYTVTPWSSKLPPAPVMEDGGSVERNLTAGN